MASTDYDVVINGTKAKIKRGVEGAYRKRYVRREIQQQLITQSENPVLASRDDYARMMQTSWAGGSAWWKPNLGPDNIDTYFQSRLMDTWSEPGKVVPMNNFSDFDETDLSDNSVLGVGANGDVYAIGDTEVDTTGFLDVYVWTPASDAFVRDAGLNSGVDDDDEPMAMVYDPSDGYFYVLTDDPEVVRFNPGTNSEDAAWITSGFSIYPGANIFLQNQNLLFYSGDQLYSIDKGSPSVTSEFNDGMGPDFLDEATFAGSEPIFRKNVKMACATPEGIYYVKNTRQGVLPVAWVFRVDKDTAGNWIGNPITTLPTGSVALGITYHLGQVIISASPNWRNILANDGDEAEVVLYFVDEGGTGALGSVLGGRDELDETPYAFLGSSGPYLYIGGKERLWVYDGIRGGLHSATTWAITPTSGAYVAMAWVDDSDGDSAVVYIGESVLLLEKGNQVDDPPTINEFGQDPVSWVESNYFDFNLPFETKELSKVEILHDPIDGDGNQQWAVRIAADDETFAAAAPDAIANSTADSTYASANLSGTTGRRFRYRLAYETKNTERVALRGLLISASGGENVLEYELMLDGEELLNVDNEVQDEQAFFDALSTIAETETQITFVDNMQEQDQETDIATTKKMKVRAVEINKDKPGESTIQVVLREA